MRILFTGASSFTGALFVRELAAAGHEVVATYRRSALDSYTEQPRAERVRMLKPLCHQVFGCSFGDEPFLRVAREGPAFDVLCHHGADVTEYRSPAFDVPGAVARNVHNLPQVLAVLRERGARAVVWTGTFFEGGEGAGSTDHASPYGLSKSVSAQIARFHARAAGLHFGRFIIPNPFGPHEEPRFTSHLVRSWYRSEIPRVLTPAYVRDNIHGVLLARAYACFVLRAARGESERHAPSGYVETQGAFAQRFADALAPRLQIPCPLEIATQESFLEPLVRINTDRPDLDEGSFDEEAAWDELARYYQRWIGERK